MSRRGFGILLVSFLGLLICSGIFVYTSPTRVVKDYIFNYKIDQMVYPESISRFLSYSKDRDLPAPSIDLKVINNSINKAEILVDFAIFTYGADGDLLKVHSGSLLFSLVRNKWSWEIDNIKIMNEMNKMK